MAASRDRYGTNTPLSTRHVQEEPKETRLPSGRCNYTNLSVGGNAPICGCRRFWDKALATPRDGLGDSIPRSQAGSGFCMCEHHACYHDDGEDQSRRVSAGIVMAEATLTTIQNTPRGPQPEVLLEVGRPQDSVPDTLPWGRYVHSGSVSSLPAIPSQCLLPSENGSVSSISQGASIRPSGLGLRAVNPMPTISSGTAMDVLPQPDARRMQIYEDANGNAFLQSLTDAATPSARVSQNVTDAEIGKNISSVQDALDKLQTNGIGSNVIAKKDHASQMRIKQSESVPGPLALTQSEITSEGFLVPRLRHLVNNLATYPTKLQNHAHRLDLLENASFSNAAVEDLQEADDRIDNHVCELEERIAELEKAHTALNDASSVGSRQLVNASFDSRASVSSSAMIASALDRLDSSRIEVLEAQVAELQAAALPSHSRPWEVEVVFLPFGSRLMGIWSSQRSSSQGSRLNSLATNDWTQTQNNSMAAAQASLTAHDRAAWETSATDLAVQNSTWLMARACGLRSRVDERLRSRGLVKVIRILGPDARDVQAAVMTAFGNLPDVLTEDPYTPHDDENAGAVPRSLKQYLGLSVPWIPLRKVHKESCLRYLNPAEMVTPALWTVPFLSASVAMRHSGVRRLYVTQRDSYIQHLGSNNADWTWQKLRQLPRVYLDQASNHTPEADAHEPCWEFDERLDPPQESFQSSFASHISSLSIRSLPHEDEDYDPASPSDHFSSAAVSPDASTTPTSLFPPRSPLVAKKERNPFRPVPTRTTSMPTTTTSIPVKSSSQPNSKRRIASFEHESQLCPSRAPSTAAINLTLAKRRRISRSPSRPRDTPRYSTGPPSPWAVFDEGREGREEAMAYATPFSNAPYIERARSRSSIGIYEDGSDNDARHEAGEGGGDGDHGSTTDDIGGEGNALSDYDSDLDLGEGQARQVEEEWEGVNEDFGGSGEYGMVRLGQEENEDGLGEEEDGEGSEASTAPSEYPSRQPETLFGMNREEEGSAQTKAGFRIHVDVEGENGVI